MPCAYVVLAHKNPQQVQRLAARLHPSPVFLHVDSGVDSAGMHRFEQAVRTLPGVSLVPRRRSAWASWGIVAAALEGMRLAMTDDRWSHLAMMSGQDYPLVATDEIDAFLEHTPGTSFMARWEMPTRLWGPDGGMHRLRYRHLPVRGRRVFLPLPRRLPTGFEPFGGSLYWVLTRDAVVDALAFANGRPDLVRFYRHSWIPDEMFIPTAVMNSPSRSGVVSEGLTYIRWPSKQSAHPVVLGAADVAELLTAAQGPSEVGGYARRKLFARKFDAEADSEVLDLLDRAAMPD